MTGSTDSNRSPTLRVVLYPRKLATKHPSRRPIGVPDTLWTAPFGCPDQGQDWNHRVGWIDEDSETGVLRLRTDFPPLPPGHGIVGVSMLRLVELVAHAGEFSGWRR